MDTPDSQPEPLNSVENLSHMSQPSILENSGNIYSAPFEAASTPDFPSLDADQSSAGANKESLTVVPAKRKAVSEKPQTPVIEYSSVCPTPILVPISIPQHTSLDVRFNHTRGYITNRLKFRYTPCGPSLEFDSKRPTFRIIDSQPEDVVRFSWEDRSPYTAITADAMVISTDRGYRAARANVPLRQGSWYFEVLIEKGGGDGGSHVRLGIGRRQSPLNAPVGFDGYSYGIRDKTGQKVHLSQPRPYGTPFESGDVIGVHVVLPSLSQELHKHYSFFEEKNSEDNQHQYHPARIVRKRNILRYKGQFYFESPEYMPQKEMNDLADSILYPSPSTDPNHNSSQNDHSKDKPSGGPTKKKSTTSQKSSMSSSSNKKSKQLPPRKLPILKGSKLYFYKNGQPMAPEPAYQDLFDFLPLAAHREAVHNTTASSSSNSNNESELTNDDGSLGYYPIVSVYGGGIARLNPGPDFKFSPQTSSLKAQTPVPRPLCERYKEYKQEIAELDEIDARILRKQLEAEETESEGEKDQDRGLTGPVVDEETPPPNIAKPAETEKPARSSLFTSNILLPKSSEAEIREVEDE